MSSQELEEKEEAAKPEYKAITLVGGTTLTFVLSKRFAKVLEVERGDYVKIVQDGKRLIIEKAT